MGVFLLGLSIWLQILLSCTNLQSYFILLTLKEMWFSHVFCEYGDRCCTESIGILFLLTVLSVLKSKLKLKSLKLNPTNKFKTNCCFIKTSKQGIHRLHGLFSGFHLPNINSLDSTPIPSTPIQNRCIFKTNCYRIRIVVQINVKDLFVDWICPNSP